MKQDATSLALLCGLSVLVNVVSSVQRGKDAVVPLTAGGVSFVGLAVFGGITGRYDVANAFAWVFLIGTLVLRGGPLIKSTTAIAQNAKSIPSTALPTASNVQGMTDKNGRPLNAGQF